MRIFYYFIESTKTHKRSMEITDVFIGDIGEHIVVRNEEHIILDYAEEIEDLEIPEDYCY